mmetsp:Transcript_126375/g.219007  ORF Transcript_126375/g.219007 Transcript_126375/m.219007 type:complete len:198 (+) Transcript_126375:90-683(+)
MAIAALLFVIAVTKASAASLRARGSHANAQRNDGTCYTVADYPGETGGAKGRSYRGLVASTVSGRTCQKWTSDKPWKDASEITPVPDEETDDGAMAWGNGLGNHNYCRNPDSSQESPWCFTMDPNNGHKKELCEIKACPKEDRDFVAEAQKLTVDIGAEVVDCDCADQLFGSTETTKDTAVKLVLLGKKGPRCNCRK